MGIYYRVNLNINQVMQQRDLSIHISNVTVIATKLVQLLYILRLALKYKLNELKVNLV